MDVDVDTTTPVPPPPSIRSSPVAPSVVAPSPTNSRHSGATIIPTVAPTTEEPPTPTIGNPNSQTQWIDYNRYISDFLQYEIELRLKRQPVNPRSHSPLLFTHEDPWFVATISEQLHKNQPSDLPRWALRVVEDSTLPSCPVYHVRHDVRHPSAQWLHSIPNRELRDRVVRWLKQCLIDVLIEIERRVAPSPPPSSSSSTTTHQPEQPHHEESATTMDLDPAVQTPPPTTTTHLYAYFYYH